MKIKYKILILFIPLILLTNCSSIKETLATKKKSQGAEEFLIEKKNPLSMPPNFNELPVPKNSEIASEQNDQDNISLLKKLQKEKKVFTGKKSNTEKKILEKILD